MGVGRVGRNEKIPVRKKKKKTFCLWNFGTGVVVIRSETPQSPRIRNTRDFFFFLIKKGIKEKEKHYGL